MDPSDNVNRPTIIRLFHESRYQSHSRKETNTQFKSLLTYSLFEAVPSASIQLIRYHFSLATIQSDVHKRIRLILEMPFWKTKNNYCIFPFLAAAVSGVLSLTDNITDQIFWKYILKKLNEYAFYCIIFLKELKVLFYLKRFLAAFPWYTMTHLVLCVSN